jgi:hypothetical protein
MTTYCLELVSTEDYHPLYREYTISKAKADKFAQFPRIQFTDSGHGIIAAVYPLNPGECRRSTIDPYRRDVSEFMRKKP